MVLCKASPNFCITSPGVLVWGWLSSCLVGAWKLAHRGPEESGLSQLFIYIYALLQQSMREQGAAVQSQLRFTSTWGCGCAASSWLNPHEPNLGTSVVLKILGPEYRPGWLPLIVHILLGRIFPSANYQSCRLMWTGTVWTWAGDHSWGQCGHGRLAQGWKNICH